MQKKIIGFLVLASCLLTFNTASSGANLDQKTVEQILDSAWDKDEFGLISYGIGETEPTISISIDKTKNEAKLRAYLNKNLSEEAKKKYDIEVFKMDIKVLETEHQKYLESLKQEKAGHE
ncbi:hypothetical protein ABE068_18360 [Bacillus glycinifermentans]|uniref:Uncharacterized protein n=1 Tax=Bacillus glycinifermentans TaxID=1664069 RepID=A0A0T6BQ77_9BACI|nr:hypothetical protein [Bacillus glycinifermentans]KRT93763.1 hypothetical protein AB447_216775 [Bacillus glycinifermentans]MEC0487327.1 hypothetical protein [Bacillus glycinifermentans]